MERNNDQEDRRARRRARDEQRISRAMELLAGVDYREEIPRQARPTEKDLAESIRAMQESGELSHLYGKPLDLSETTTDWMMRRILKDAGFSHPLLERGKDLDTARGAIEKIVEELRRRRNWLADPEARCTPTRAHMFNQERLDALAAYRTKLAELDRAILGYNLTVPTSLQRRQLKVDELVSAAAQAVPPLDLEPQAASASSPSFRGWLSAVLRRSPHP